MTFHIHRSAGDLPGPLGPFDKAIYLLAKLVVAAADGEQPVQGPALPRAPDVRVVGLSSLVYVLGPGLCGGGEA